MCASLPESGIISPKENHSSRTYMWSTNFLMIHLVLYKVTCVTTIPTDENNSSKKCNCTVEKIESRLFSTVVFYFFTNELYLL